MSEVDLSTALEPIERSDVSGGGQPDPLSRPFVAPLC